MFTESIRNPILRSAAEWLVLLSVAALLFLFVRTFLFRMAHVDGNSMAPTLEHGDMVVLNRLAYHLSSPRIGDIVAFPYAENPSEFYIKRIIAGPGDVVYFDSGFFYVNEERLIDDFSHNPTIALGDVVFPVTVEDERFFVLGDNRNGSQDSRFISVGTIPAPDMVGRATIRLWPLSRIGRVD